MQKSCILILLLINLTFPNHAQTYDERNSKIDALFTQQISKGDPGAVVGIIENGVFTYKGSFGMANLDYDIPLTTSSVFRIASTSKQFTAAIIFLLERQGKINLEDDIRKYLADFPFYGDTIRVKHLIYHTSGIRDYTGLMYLCSIDDDIQYSPNDLYELILRQKGVDFKPGSQFSYSTTGYFLLSKIVESVTGTSLNNYAQENIFIPLGMSNTHFHDNYRSIVKNRAYGYHRGEDAYEILMNNSNVVGDGGIFTTLDDLKLWDQNFYTHKIGGLDWYEKMITPGKLNDGSATPYAGGLFIRKYRGLKKINHSGWSVGFKAIVARYPEAKTTIMILANNTDLRPPVLTNRIADIVLEDKLTPRVASNRVAPSTSPEDKTLLKVPDAIMQALVGKYYSPELNFRYRLVINDGKLICEIGNNDRKQIHFIDKDNLSVDEYVTLSPIWTKADKISAFTLSVGDTKNIRFDRVNTTD